MISIPDIRPTTCQIFALPIMECPLYRISCLRHPVSRSIIQPDIEFDRKGYPIHIQIIETNPHLRVNSLHINDNNSLAAKEISSEALGYLGRHCTNIRYLSTSSVGELRESDLKAGFLNVQVLKINFFSNRQSCGSG